MNDLQTRIAALREAVEKMTSAPWAWWTSNSTKRLTHERDGDVAYGYASRSDGVGDIAIKADDMAGIVALRNNALAIIEAQAAEIARLQERDAKLLSKQGTFKGTGDPALDACLQTPDEDFRAFVETMPPSYWARYDLSAVRLGWHYGQARKDAEIERLRNENFTLAAGVCPVGFGDQGGTPRCCAEAEIERLRTLLTRYRDETPLGHQPHMIAHVVDKALGRGPVTRREGE